MHPLSRKELLNQAMNSGGTRLLPKVQHLESVTLASYPRTGNTMLRDYIEKISRIYTGSDIIGYEELELLKKEKEDSKKKPKSESSTPINQIQNAQGTTDSIFSPEKFLAVFNDFRMSLNLFLKESGLDGEGLVGKEVWIARTHFPNLPSFKEYQVQKCVLIIRNPLDVVHSYFHNMGSKTHHQSMTQEDVQKKQYLLDEMIPMFIEDFNAFYDFWLNHEIPIHLIRYEDILENPVKELTNLFKFLLEIEDTSEIGLEQKVYNVVHGKCSSSSHGYFRFHIWLFLSNEI